MDDTTPAELRCGNLLREVARLYTRAQRTVADCCGSTSTQCHILMELGRSGALPMNELGRRLNLEKSWVSRAIDTLFNDGIVDKRPNADDARSWLVALTAKGRRRFAELNHTLDEHANRVLRSLSAEELATVNRSLEIVLRALRADASGVECCNLSTDGSAGAACDAARGACS
jgi:DNA-binding MarR family transcriptional regulator